MKYVFLVAFIVSTAIHLYASLKQNTKLRNYSKPFILLALLGFYALTARSVLLAIILALIFSWIGDVLLIPKGKYLLLLMMPLITSIYLMFEKRVGQTIP